MALRGGGNKPAAAPPINAGSSDEADFIKYFELHPDPRRDVQPLTLRQEVHGGSRGGGEKDEALNGVGYRVMDMERWFPVGSTRHR